MTPTQQIDGIDVYVEGEGDQTVVMIHGWPDSYRLWDAQVQAFKGRYRCVRFTLPGFDLGKPKRPVSLAQMVALFKTVIEQTSPGQQVILMVHDWGCVFGYEFAMRHPELVARLVGVDIGDANSKDFARSTGLKAKAMIFGYQVWLALAWRIGGALGDRMSRFMARSLKWRGDESQVAAQMNYPYDMQWTGSYGSLRHTLPVAPACPMLFIYATHKPFMFHSKGWADALAQRPGNQVVALPTGHWVMRQKPDVFNQTVLSWLATRR